MTDRFVTIEEFADRLLKRRNRLGLAKRRILPNSGKFRTANKKALLERLADRARAQGRAPAFPANF